ncbi:MAG: glycosyltransferase family 39 protein [Myxococcota bacterium]
MAIVKKPPDHDEFPAASTQEPPTPASRAADPAIPASPGPRSRAVLAGLLACAGVLYLTGLGTLDLWAPDEPRYGAIAEELRSGRHGPGGLVLLHLNGEPYDQKPPLYFWLAAAFGLPFGRVDEVAARLPSALAGVAGVGLTFAIARLLGRSTISALLSAGLLATSFRFAFSARRAQLDVLLTACELAAIAVFLVIETRRGGIEQARRHPGLLAVLHGALGAAALVKGPVGWLPLLVFAAWLAWEGRLAAFGRLVPVWSWVLSLGPVCAWISGATALAPEGFAQGAVADNVFARFFAGTSHVRPFYYYGYQLPLDFLPWTLLWPLALPVLARACRDARPEATSDRAGARLLAAWCVVPLVFFTLSAGKRGLYLLPIHPALALVTSLAVASPAWERAVRGARGLAARPLAIAIAAVAVVELAIALLVLPRLDGEKSPRPIADAIARHGDAASAVGVYRLRPLEGAIPYYGGRPVASLASETAAERFLAEAEGRRRDLILLRGSDFDALRERLALEPLERFRSGRRELVLAHARPRPPGPPPIVGRSDAPH